MLTAVKVIAFLVVPLAIGIFAMPKVRKYVRTKINSETIEAVENCVTEIKNYIKEIKNVVDFLLGEDISNFLSNVLAIIGKLVSMPLIR